MTANVKVEIAKRSDVLRVPNAALRFRPSTDIFAALNQPVPPEALEHRRPRRTRRSGPRHARRRHRCRHRHLRHRRRQPARRAAAPLRAGATPAALASVAGPSAVRVPPPAPRRLRAARGGGGGRGFDPGAHDGALQGHVARRSEAVHRPHEGSRPGHQPVREGNAARRRRRRPRAKAPSPRRARRPSTRCSRRCRRSSRAAAPGCSSTTS